MNPLRTATLIVCLLLPSLCFAQDYAISGPAMFGKAKVTPMESTPSPGDDTRYVTVDATWTTATRFKKNYETRTLSGAVGRVDPDGTLHFGYDVEKPGNMWHGLTSLLGNPMGLGERSETERTETVTVTLRPDGEAQLVGDVEGVTQTWTVQRDLDDLVVLVIPGLATNNWNRVGIPYLDENLAVLEARGIEARRLGISTESSVRTNALFIAREISREGARGKRVIVMAHSKGATDTTAALALYPYLIEHVVGVIAIQPVYGGSPVAKAVAERRALKGTVKVIFERVFGGSDAAVLDLVPTARAAFVREHPYPAAQVPTVVIRSCFDRPRGQRFTVLTPTQRLITRELAKRNDGMVTLEDQVIPGAVETIDYDDLDHFEPGVRAHSPYTPTDVTNAGINAMLRHVRQDAPPQQETK